MEEIKLVNDGSGLGFGIVGGTAGVVVRTLVPHSVAHRVRPLISSGSAVLDHFWSKSQ